MFNEWLTITLCEKIHSLHQRNAIAVTERHLIIASVQVLYSNGEAPQVGDRGIITLLACQCHTGGKPFSTLPR